MDWCSSKILCVKSGEVLLEREDKCIKNDQNASGILGTTKNEGSIALAIGLLGLAKLQ